MDIRVYQRGGDKTNLLLYRKAVEFFTNKLLTKTEREGCRIDLKLMKIPHYGVAERVGRGKRFKVCLDRGSSFLVNLLTLAHEMVHIKQYIRGELRTGEASFTWKGKIYKHDNHKEYPWEIEAHKKEKPLMNEFLTWIHSLDSDAVEALDNNSEIS